MTGGTGKLGSVLLRHFVGRGWSVIVTTRERAKAEKLIATLGPSCHLATAVEVNLQEAGAAENVVAELEDSNISIDCLVNNARSLESLSVDINGITLPAHFHDEFNLDVVVPYRLSVALAHSEYHRLAAIVNIGSMYGVVAPNPELYGGTLDSSPIQYGVCKAALHQLTRELAVRLAPKHIRVNCVAFGGVEGRVSEEFIKRYARLVPAGRMLRESEITGPVEFLLSDQSSAVNGQVILADGGWTLW